MIPEIKKIVYATGLGSGAPYVFRYALSLARKYDATIEVVCGLAPLTPQVQGVADIYIGQEESKEFHRQARDRVKHSVEQQVGGILVVRKPGKIRANRLALLLSMTPKGLNTSKPSLSSNKRLTGPSCNVPRTLMQM